MRDPSCSFSCADPSPGVLVVTPGRELIMTCRGHVTIDGLEVRNGSKTSRGDGSPADVTSKTTTALKQALVNSANTGNRSSGRTASPAAHVARLASVHRLSESQDVDQDTEKEEKEEWKDGSRGTRGENSSLQWRWTGRMVQKRDKDVKWSRGATLSLSSVRVADSGTFTCYHRSKEMFSLKVTVAGESHKE